MTPAKKVGLVARTFLMTTGHVSADFRQGTSSVRNGVRPDKLTVNDEDAIAKSRRNLIPRVSTRFGLSVENEWVGAGRDSRTRLARPDSQTRTGTGTHIVPCSADREQDWQLNPAHTLLNVLTIHTYRTGGIFCRNV